MALMQAKQRLLIAAQPEAAAVLMGMLGETLDLTVVHTINDGVVALKRERSIALIVSTVAFDESRMLDFLIAVKTNATISGTPFLCCRILSTVFSEHSMERLGKICRDLGAVAFVDFAALDQRYGSEVARAQFKDAVMSYVDAALITKAASAA
jgi:hypothetical protein